LSTSSQEGKVSLKATTKSAGGDGGEGSAVVVPLCAYPRTFFGSSAVAWMLGLELGLASEEDVMVVGDLMLFQVSILMHILHK